MEGIKFYTLKIHLTKFIKSSFNLLIHCSCSIFVSGMVSEVSEFSESKYYLSTLISEMFNVWVLLSISSASVLLLSIDPDGPNISNSRVS